MARIFVSWSSPDAAEVKPFLSRLRDLGLGIDLWEFSENMPAGVTIHEHVLDIIHQVDLAVVCFSDATAERDWIRTETDWCYKERDDRRRQGGDFQILPVWIGPHPQNKIPLIFQQTNLTTADVADGGDAEFERFVDDLYKKLKSEAPRVIPAAFFAMTRQQLQSLFTPQPPGTLIDLCRALGMPPAPSDLLLALESRYGNTPEEFAPFLPGETLLSSVHSVLGRANEARLGDQPKRRPIHLRWIEAARLVGPQSNQTLRDEWQDNDSLLVVDSISAFHPEIRIQLTDLPDNMTRTALLWVPPYSLHTAAQEETLRLTAAVIRRFGDIFRTWEVDPRRAITFDTTTLVSLRLWLHRTLYGIPDEVGPDEKRVRSIPRAGSSSLNDFFRVSAPGSLRR